MKSFQALLTSLMVLPLSLTSIGCGPDVDDIEAKIGDRAMETRTFSAIFHPSEAWSSQLALHSSEGQSCGLRGDESMIWTTIFINAPLADIRLGEPIPIDSSDQKSQVLVGVKAFTGSCEFTEGQARKVTGTVTFTDLSEEGAEGDIDVRAEEVESECAALSAIPVIEYKWTSFTTPSYSNELCE